MADGGDARVARRSARHRSRVPRARPHAGRYPAAGAALVGCEHVLEDARSGDALAAFADVARLPGRVLRKRLAQAAPRRGMGASPVSGSFPAAIALLQPAAALAVGTRSPTSAAPRDQVGVRLRCSESSVDEAVVPRAGATCWRRPPVRRSPAADILHWRARCSRRDRDWYAAQEDVERALELAEASARLAADALFQRRSSHSGKGARYSRAYAEAIRGRCSRRFGDVQPSPARRPRRAESPPRTPVAILFEAFALFVDLDLAVDRLRARHMRDPASSVATSRPRGRTPLKALDLLGQVDALRDRHGATRSDRSYAGTGEVDDAEKWIAIATRPSVRRSSSGIAATHGSRRATSTPYAAATQLQPPLQAAALALQRRCSARNGKTRPLATHGGERPLGLD